MRYWRHQKRVINITSIHCRGATVSASITLLAIGSALSLMIIEVVHVGKRVISPTYLAAAVIQSMLIGLWVLDFVLF